MCKAVGQITYHIRLWTHSYPVTTPLQHSVARLQRTSKDCFPFTYTRHDNPSHT